MRRIGFLLSLSLALLLFCSVGTLALAASSVGLTIACNSDAETYMLDVPAGWASLPEGAGGLGLCAVLAPEGGDAQAAQARIYARMAGPGGSATESGKLSNSGRIFSDSGVAFEMSYLDKSSAKNGFEMIASHAGKDATLVVTLSAPSPEWRLKHMPDFMRALKSVKAYEVMGQLSGN